MMLPYHSVKFVNASELAAEASCLVEPSRKRRNEIGGLTGKEAREFYENALQQLSTQAEMDVALRKHPSAKKAVQRSNSDTEVKLKCYAVSKSPFSPQSRFLRAASEGSVSEMKILLNSHKIDVNFVDDFGWSALMCASYGGHLGAVVFLLENAAIASLKSRNGHSAADLAAKAGHLQIYNILTQNGTFLNELCLSVNYAYLEREIECDASPGGSKADSSKEGSSGLLPDYCSDCERPFLDQRHITSTAHLVRTWNVDSKPCFSLGQSNVGYKLLVKGGWNQASGLGKCQEGKWYPLKTILKRDRKGLGCPNGSKPRVTHFGPFDKAAVSRPGQNNPPKLLRKNQLDFVERRCKAIAQKFRREFYE
ncbi:G-patch and Ank 2 domain containing protein [Trichuris trichiura]|uniref:G-patch and Ank 2 domain containing protein n=1 Tax=Trichuris trichiura TaxID=36087 RepID=A0A077Z1R5_TRITR|nr:G-patch and Ank 2 domain containing protein [Trichuris trichiura]